MREGDRGGSRDEVVEGGKYIRMFIRAAECATQDERFSGDF